MGPSAHLGCRCRRPGDGSRPGDQRLADLGILTFLLMVFSVSGSATFATVRHYRRFCVNVLAEEQAEICHGFARFDGATFDLGWWESHHGIPAVTDAVAVVLLPLCCANGTMSCRPLRRGRF